MDDSLMLEHLKKGDTDAFEGIVISYTRYVSAVIANVLGDFSDIPLIEEIASDVFFELWRQRETLRTPNIKGWLAATARNKAKNHLRDMKMHFVSLDTDFAETTFLCDDVFAEVEKEERSAMLSHALEKLGGEERETVIRYYYYCQNVMRISEETDTNVETVKSRLRRGREKLKKILMGGGHSE